MLSVIIEAAHYIWRIRERHGGKVILLAAR